MRDWTKLILVFTISLVLAACGGDGLGTSDSPAGDQDTPTPTPGPDDPIPTSDATNIDLLVSSPQMPSDGSNTVTLTAVARDDNNNYVANTEIEFSASSGGISPGERTVTDSSGRVSAVLDIGGNPSNRMISVIATDAITRQSADQTVVVTDTRFLFTGPQRIEVGEEADLVVQLVDSGNNPIAFKPILLSSFLGNTIRPVDGSLVTDETGQVRVVISGGVDGPEVITATSEFNANDNSYPLEIIPVDAVSFHFELPIDDVEIALNTDENFRICLTDNSDAVGAGTTIQLSSTRGVFASSGGTIASYDSDGAAECWEDTISSQGAGFSQVMAKTSSTGAYDNLNVSTSLEFISTSVSFVNAQAAKSILESEEKTMIIATLRDANYNLVKNKTVGFSIESDASKGSLSPPTAITDSNGQATVVYTAGKSGSGLGDVIIKAEDLDSGIADTTGITVKNRALHVALGTGNSMTNYDDGSFTSYALPYSAIVTDSAGQSVANQSVSISIWSHRYYKGSYYPTYTPAAAFLIYSAAPTDEYEWNVANDGIVNWGRAVVCGNEDTDLNGIASFNEDINGNGLLDVNEDLNGNGLLDTYEDSNGNGVLDAGEDLNGNGILDLPVDTDVNANGRLNPGNIATISVDDTIGAFSVTTTTDENGVAVFAIIYAEQYANWLEISLEASVIVDGTEDSTRTRFILPALASDVNDVKNQPAGYISPFGRGYANGLIQGCTVDEF